MLLPIADRPALIRDTLLKSIPARGVATCEAAVTGDATPRCVQSESEEQFAGKMVNRTGHRDARIRRSPCKAGRAGRTSASCPFQHECSNRCNPSYEGQKQSEPTAKRSFSGGFVQPQSSGVGIMEVVPVNFYCCQMSDGLR